MEFLKCIDNNLAFYEIHANLACAYLKGHLVGWARDSFEVIGYSYVRGTVTDFAQLKEALTKNFPVVKNRSKLEVQFFSLYQVRCQAPSDLVNNLLKIQKTLQLEMTEEKLLDHIITRLAPKVTDYVEVKNPTTKAQLLQLVAKYKESPAGRGAQSPINNVGGQDWDSRRRVLKKRRDGNWGNAHVANRQDDTRETNVDSNGF
ncbi:uncharacterized protein TNCV_2595561 [Trichonephila clavipes]|nr:uncharacterized protein TNCV_2595561 [Trichonephila clavipes]